MVTQERGGEQYCLQLQRHREQRGDHFSKLAPVRVCEQLLLELRLDSVYVFIIYLKCDG